MRTVFINVVNHYYHLFTTFGDLPDSGYVKSGDLLLIPYPANEDSLPERRWAIMWTPSNGDTSVWGASTNPVHFNGDTLPVFNYLSAGHVLGPLGNSGAGTGNAHFLLSAIKSKQLWVQASSIVKYDFVKDYIEIF